MPGPSLFQQTTGNFEPMAAPQGPRFGYGQMAGVVGRGGRRGSRGSMGGFHEESFESFQARCNPAAGKAMFAMQEGAAEAFKAQFVGRGSARGWVKTVGWGAQAPLVKKPANTEPPVRMGG